MLFRSGTKYLEIAGACREILKVPIAKQLDTQADRLTQLAFSLGVSRVSYGGFKTATGGGTTGGGTGTNINITTGIGTNGIEAGRQIVEVLQQYSRIGGNNFLEFAVA